MVPQFLTTIAPFTRDILVLVGVFIVIFAYAMYFGKSRIISAIIAFYPAQFLLEHFPYMDKLLVLKGEGLIVANKVLIFLIFFVPLNIIIGRYIFADSGYGAGKAFRVAGFALAGVILVMIFTYAIVDLNVLYNFTPTIDKLFSPDKIFYWNLAPIAILFAL